MSEAFGRKNKNQNIQVFVRLRPINAREKEIKSQVAVECTGNREVVVKQQHFEMKHTKKFTFDRVFGPCSSQVEVYKSVVSPLIEEVLSGYSCTVFAYGQTGTGKTFTMAGGAPKYEDCDTTSWKNDPLAGIIPRAINQLFDDLRLAQMEFTIRVSYLELYNEELFDLLAPKIDESNSNKIRIYEDPMKKGSVIVQGLEEIHVKNKGDVYKILTEGQEKRKTAATLMNAQSSRSHTIFSILVHVKEVSNDDEAMLKTGKLNLVDLAGSENISKAGNDKKERARETVNINQSLLTLGRVITALVEKTPHVPYRESKLTRLLQDSLGGRTKTSIIATISPGHKDLEETLSTLDYAHRAKHIMNKPEINQKLTQKLAIKCYTNEIDRLKRELFAQRERHGVYLTNKDHHDLLLKLDQQDTEISDNIQKIRAFEEEKCKITNIFEQIKNKYLKTKQELKSTKTNLNYVERQFKNAEKNLKKAEIVKEEKSYLIEVQARTEKLLSDQARELINVAEITTKDTEKLQNVLETRRTIDNIIKTSAELFNDQMKTSLQLKKNALRDEYSQCSIKNEEINNSIGFLKKSNAQVLEKLLGNMQKISINFQNLIQKIKMLDGIYISKTDNVLKNLVQTNLKTIELQVLYINTTFSEIHKDLIELMFVTNERREKYDDDMFRSISDVDNNKFEAVNMYMENNQEQAELLKHLFDEVFGYMEDNGVINEDLKNRAKSVLDMMKQNATSFSDNYKHQSQKSSDIIKSAKELSKHINVKQGDNITDLDNNITILKTKYKNAMSLMKDNNDQLYKSVKSLIDEHSDCSPKEYVQYQSMLDKQINDDKIYANLQFDSLEKQLENISSKNERLNKYLEDLSQNVDSCINNVLSDIEKYCCEEVQIYRPTGETPVRKTYNFPKVLASTSPHERIIQRFRIEQGYAACLESLDNSIVEMEESFDDSDDIINLNIEEQSQVLEIEESLSKSKWLSESTLNTSTTVQENSTKFQLTKSTSAIEINNMKHFGKENIPVERPRSASKYDNANSSIPIIKRKVAKILEMNNS